jgi:hypothetical protein
MPTLLDSILRCHEEVTGGVLLDCVLVHAREPHVVPGRELQGQECMNWFMASLAHTCDLDAHGFVLL